MTELARDEEFSAFVLARRPELLRSACLLTAGDWHSAEDLVQVALARLYVAWPRVRRTGTQVAYAWRIIVNAHIDEVRRPWWRREQSVAAPPDTPDPGALAAFPDGADGGAVRAALAALPAGMRAAVVLRHWADFSVQDTAQILGCSAGTVKSQTAKGIARLRDLADVRGRTAYYWVEGSIASLVIEQTPGRWLDVQAPTSLGWTEQQEAQFGAGVTILPTAQEGRG